MKFFTRINREAMQKVIAICMIVAVSMSSLLMTGCGKQKERDAVDVTYIATKLEGISELATAKMTMKGIVHVTEGKIPLINKKEFYMIYRAAVKAGFDLSQAEITVTDNTVQINLPEVAVFDILVEEDSLEFFDKTDSWFNQEDMEDAAKAIAAAKEDIQAQPEIDELKRTAVEQVKIVLTGLLESQIGDRELIINIG